MKFKGKEMIPPAGENATRFFKWIDDRRAQDSEAKIFEFILDRIAAEKGIIILYAPQ